MIRNFEELSTDAIAWSDTQFKLTFRQVPELLRISIREFGVLNPLIVTESASPDRFTIVTGWLRFNAAREHGDNSVPCHIYHNFPHKIMQLCALFDNIGHRTFNAIEQALTVRSLAQYYNKAEVVANFLPLFGWAPSTKGWDMLIPLLDLPEAIQRAVADGCIDEYAARVMGRLPGTHGQRVFRLICGINARHSFQRELAAAFYDIWQRQDVPPGVIIDEEDWAQFEQAAPAMPERQQLIFELPRSEDDPHVLRGTRTERTETHARGDKVARAHARRAPLSPADAQKASRIVRDGLRRRRTPHLKKLDDARADVLRKIKLPATASISPAESRNGAAHRLQLTFDSEEQLKSSLERLLDAEERGVFMELFKASSKFGRQTRSR